jgi:putative ABC transport system substrate-binding protein
LGYREGQNVAFESRVAAGNLDQLSDLASQLVRSKVDVIVAVGPHAIKAANQATTTIPIIMAYWGTDGLVESKLVDSFARPGGNVTGVYMLASELDAKRLEILLQAVPTAKNIAVLDPGTGFPLTQVQQVAHAANVQLRVIQVPGDTGYEQALASMTNQRVDALLVPSVPKFAQDRGRIIALAAKGRIPAMYEWGEIAELGGLMAYGPTQIELDRLAAGYVDRILRGNRSAELAIVQPTKFEFIINMKTARTLGLTIPQSVLLRADKLIE